MFNEICLLAHCDVLANPEKYAVENGAASRYVIHHIIVAVGAFNAMRYIRGGFYRWEKRWRGV